MKPIKLISLPTLHTLRLMGLVRRVQLVAIEGAGSRPWCVRIEGGGFVRLLDDGGSHQYFQPLSALVRQPARFLTRSQAARWAKDVRLGISDDC